MSAWKRKKIIEISSVFQDGDWIESKDQSIEGIRLIQTGNIGIGVFKARNEKSRYISEATFNRLRCTEIFEGDVLVSRLPDPVGRACILPYLGSKMITAVDCTILRFEKDELIPYWFLYYTLSIEYQNEIQRQVTGATRQRISRKNLGLISIPLPPLPEQQRIVSILDRAFAAIDQAKVNAEKNLQNAKELFKSYLRKVLDELALEHNQTTLGVSCEFFNGKAHEKEIDIAGDYIVVNSKFISSEGETIKKTANQMFPLFTNDIVMVMSDVPNGKALAKCAIIDVDNLYSLNQRICCIRSDNYDTKFLYYQLNRHPYLLAFNNGENQTNLRKGDILNTPLTLPVIEVQRAVTSKLDEVKGQAKQLETTYQKKVNDLDELKRSILEKAFKGELVIDTELETT